ncbi:MAG: hypothetical protein M1832_005858 [Thelocarpon impressellum]|nr:MAG: hypothetical protein M1832_005858 [Thelocarpon impressellum]
MSAVNHNAVVLSSRDPNAPVASADGGQDGGKSVKSMEYHRQVLQSRLKEDGGKQTYVSPSDNIMSPCTAKLSAYRSKHFMKAKPQSLFAKASSKSMGQSPAEGEVSKQSQDGQDSQDSSAASQASSEGF